MDKFEFIDEVFESVEKNTDCMTWFANLIGNIYDYAYDAYGHPKNEAKYFLKNMMPKLEDFDFEQLPEYSESGKYKEKCLQRKLIPVREWLKSIIESYCIDGIYYCPAIYYDCISPEVVNEAFCYYRKSLKGSFSNFLENHLLDVYDLEDNFTNLLEDEHSKIGEIKGIINISKSNFAKEENVDGLDNIELNVKEDIATIENYIELSIGLQHKQLLEDAIMILAGNVK